MSIHDPWQLQLRTISIVPSNALPNQTTTQPPLSTHRIRYAIGAAPPPPLQVSYSRPTSLHDQQLQQQQQQQQHQQEPQETQQVEQEQQQLQQQQHAYADAYAALGRGQYESTTRAPNNSKV